MKLRSLLLGSALCLGLSAFAQTTFDGLVGHWKFDEGTGTTVGDELGVTNGELVNPGAAIWVDGFEGKALDFASVADGADASYARFPGDGAADLDGPFSFSMWIRGEMSPDGDTEYSIISKGVPNTTTGGWYHFSLKENKLRFMIWPGTGGVTSPNGYLPEGMTWDANTWYHIVCTRDYDRDYNLYLFLNGEQIDSIADAVLDPINCDGDLTFGSVANGVATTIGDNLWGSNYKGSLDEVQLYNVALSPEQVKTMYDTYTGASNGVSDKYVDNLQIAPNPVANNLMLQNASNISKVEIYNLTGALVKTINSQNAALINANVQDLTSGMYVVKAFNLDNTVSAGKFSKK